MYSWRRVMRVSLPVRSMGLQVEWVNLKQVSK
jgi:hypothetical protein